MESNSDKFSSVNFLSFAKYTSYYACLLIFDYIPVMYTFYLYNQKDVTQFTSMSGLLESLFYISLGYCFDFFEPVNTLCGPLFSEKKYPEFTLNLCKIFMFNMLFYILGNILILLFQFVINGNSDLFRPILVASYSYLFIYTSTAMLAFTLNNYIRGNFYI